MGFFDDVRLYVEDLDIGHGLVIEVVERPAVASIRIRGNDKVDKDDIRAKVALGVGSTLDESILRKSVEDIVALYREKGYFFAKVRHEITSVGETSGVSGVRLDG